MKEITPYTDQSNTLDTLGIAYQRLRSCNKSDNHTSTERLLLGAIMDILDKGEISENFEEVVDTLSKLYQRVASVNTKIETTGFYKKVIVTVEELIEKQL